MENVEKLNYNNGKPIQSYNRGDDMLIQFSVENFRSIKSKALFSMEAAKDEDHAVQVATIGKERILKTAAIFGVNAAGKSNIFAAFCRIPDRWKRRSI
mgnify:CR=1 FL=1